MRKCYAIKEFKIHFKSQFGLTIKENEIFEYTTSVSFHNDTHTVFTDWGRIPMSEKFFKDHFYTLNQLRKQKLEKLMK